MRAKVDSPGTQAFYLWFGCGWPQPTRYQRKVDVQVRNLLTNDELGTTLDRTVVWYAHGRFVVIIQFPWTLEVSKEIYVKLEVTWPGKCLPLMQGSCDRYTLNLDHLLSYVRYRIVLPKDMDTYTDPIGFREGVTLKSGRDEEDRLTHVIEARDLPPNHAVGLQLELKKRASLAVRQ